MRRDRPISRLPTASGTSLRSIVILVLLLVLPAQAVFHLGSPERWIAAGIVLAMSLAATAATQRDKLKAMAGEWRTPESTLHVLELLGGWPGAFLAQRRYRHKTAKFSYQLTFWAIVTLYQVIAAEFLSDGQLSVFVGTWFNYLVRSVSR